MNASHVKAAERPALTRSLVLPLVIPSQSSGTDAAGGSVRVHPAVPAAGRPLSAAPPPILRRSVPAGH